MNGNDDKLTILSAVADGDPETLKRMAAARQVRPKPNRIGNVKQAAELLGVCPRTIFRYAERGRIRLIRQSARRVRVNLDEVERLAVEGIQL